jgi:hypothetical protein
VFSTWGWLLAFSIVNHLRGNRDVWHKNAGTYIGEHGPRPKKNLFMSRQKKRCNAEQERKAAGESDDSLALSDSRRDLVHSQQPSPGFGPVVQEAPMPTTPVHHHIPRVPPSYPQSEARQVEAYQPAQPHRVRWQGHEDEPSPRDLTAGQYQPAPEEYYAPPVPSKGAMPGIYGDDNADRV